MTIWTVTETACYPCSWKVHPIGKWGDNATHNFFRTVQEAWEEANRRNRDEEIEPDFSPCSLCPPC